MVKMQRDLLYFYLPFIYIYFLFKSTIGFVGSTYPMVDLKKRWMRNGELTPK